MSKSALTREEKIQLIKQKLEKRKRKGSFDLSNLQVWFVDNDGNHSLSGSTEVLTDRQFSNLLKREGLDRTDIITFR